MCTREECVCVFVCKEEGCVCEGEDSVCSMCVWKEKDCCCRIQLCQSPSGRSSLLSPRGALREVPTTFMFS